MHVDNGANLLLFKVNIKNMPIQLTAHSSSIWEESNIPFHLFAPCSHSVIPIFEQSFIPPPPKFGAKLAPSLMRKGAYGAKIPKTFRSRN